MNMTVMTSDFAPQVAKYPKSSPKTPKIVWQPIVFSVSDAACFILFVQ